jgi:glycosyltransferase involved in cell wall biosynthesis
MNKTVSIVLPVRNERKYISRCLYSILTQDYPGDKGEGGIASANASQRLGVGDEIAPRNDGEGKGEILRQSLRMTGNVEVLVVDGMSNDGTRDFLKEYVKKHKNVRMIDNPDKIVPIALNIGIKNAKGDIILRMDAHATYAPDYVSKCVEYLEKTGSENVGGVVKHKGEGFIGTAIALVQGFPFGLGGAKFRTAKKEQYIDTVFPGAWRKEVFEKYGYFNEELVRNQDIEHNARIRKGGGKIFLTPEIKSEYFCRPGLIGLWKQNFRNGYWNIKTMKIAPGTLSIRHFVPLVFVLSLLTTSFINLYLWFFIVDCYIAASVFSSTILAKRNGVKYFFILPLVFLTLHISYGVGSLVGIVGLFRKKT